MAASQTPQQNLKIIGKTCGQSLARAILNSGNVSIANALRNIAEFFMGAALGTRGVNLFVSAGGVAASQTLTLSGFSNTNTVVINGVTLTGTSGSITTNAQFKIGTSDTITAQNIVARIMNTDGNASGVPPSKIWGVIYATSAAAVVTLTAVEPGAIANLYTLTCAAGGTAGGATFANGTDGTITYLSKGL
jgi:hypothetical protein